MLAGVLALAAAATGLGLLASVDGGRVTSSGSATQEARDGRADTARAVPARFAGGPTGGAANVDLRPDAGMFATECEFSHESDDDPIVFPGEEGAAHHHNFFGNTTTDYTSTIETLLGGPTSCRLQGDSAAYWAPALSRDGEFLQPIASDAYYRVAPGVDPADLEPYPEGLMMIAGDAHATQPQDLDVVAWACDRSQRISDAPVECPEGAELTVRVTFPDCWNGRDTDSEDHKSHVAYSSSEGCPVSHPVAMPVLTFVVHYPVTGSVEGLGLSPGSLLNGHADFVNTWDPEVLRREIDHCLKKGLVCSSPGGTGGSPPLF